MCRKNIPKSGMTSAFGTCEFRSLDSEVFIMKMKRHWVTASLAAVGLLVPAAVGAQVLTAPCLDPTVPLVVEEARLPNKMPDASNPAVLASKPFSQQMIEGAGFQDFGPAFVATLCAAGNLNAAQHIVENLAEELWKRATARAQQLVEVQGSL